MRRLCCFSRVISYASKRFLNLKMDKPLDFKTLSLENYDCYGFDIDHTLAKYKLHNLFPDSYNAMTNYLVKKKGYPEDAFSFDKDFCTRGLVLDLELGHFMKLAEDGRILRATHGTRSMTHDELKNVFGETLKWEHFETLVNSVDNVGARYRIFENFFDMPVAVVCAHVIDCLAKKDVGKHQQRYNFWPEVFEAINFVYNPKQYEADDGEFFPRWKRDTGRYVQTCSEDLKRWLKKLRENNKKLFVITSSYEDFAKASLKYILGNDWDACFDLCVTLAKKPSFFTGENAFTKLDESGKMVPVIGLDAGKFYLGGNSKVLMKHLEKLTGKSQPKILFFGDSLRSDVFPAKKFGGWDTVFVLNEISAQLMQAETTNSTTETVEPPTKKRKSDISNEEERSYLCSRRWGSLFTDGHNDEELVKNGSTDTSNRPTCNTLWSYLIHKYADIAVSDLDCITKYSMDFKFKRFDETNPNKTSYYLDGERESQL